jgi:hypothetical protein
MLDDVARSKTLVFPPNAQRIELAVGRFIRSRLVTESSTDRVHGYDPGYALVFTPLDPSGATLVDQNVFTIGQDGGLLVQA